MRTLKTLALLLVTLPAYLGSVLLPGHPVTRWYEAEAVRVLSGE